MSSLYIRIETLCKSKGVNITQMCKEAGVSRGNLTDLKMGRQSGLSATNLEKIADYFGVTINELLGNKKEPAAVGNELSDEEKLFLTWYRTQATEKDKAIVRAIIEGE